jgi:hypothetical protein
MHYFFEKKSTLHSFLRNLSECTRLGGYFVGTCYNGQRVFDALRNKKMGESIRFDKNGKKIFEIVRQYSNQLDKFPQNENSIGLAIHVFQESINKSFEEYLVNFPYFTSLMEVYGFVPLGKSDLAAMNVMDSNGSFEQLYRQLERSKNDDTYYGQSLNMSKEEKIISFFNQYFIYKKVRNVSAEQFSKLWENYVSSEMEESVSDLDLDLEKGKTGIAKKIADKKIVLSLSNYSPIKESEVVDLGEDKKSEEKEIAKEEKTSEPDLGEWESVFNRLNKDVQEKLRKYPVDKQIELLKRMQKPKTKVVTANK